jgi:predicted deacetylase
VPAALDTGAAMSVTLHDVAPATQQRCERLIDRLQQIAAMPLTLLVVPHYQGRLSDPDFERWLQGRAQGGDELALHGLTHRDEGPPPNSLAERARRHWYTDREGEFAALDGAEATRRLRAGQRWFELRGWPLRGFVAPAWLLSEQSWLALLQQPFEYTCTRTALLALPRGAPDQPLRSLHAPSIVYSTRAAWRRALSRPRNALLAHEERRQAWMRFELHPDDAQHEAVFDSLLRLVERAVDDGREALTLGELASRLRAPLSSEGTTPGASRGRVPRALS